MRIKRRLFLELLCVWASAVAFAYALAFLLPNTSGFTVTTPARTIYLSSSRIAVRGSILLGVLASSVLLVRAASK